jgi:CheY-like chemotaxis protein
MTRRGADLTEAARYANYDVRPVASAEAALRAARERRPGIIDIVMSSMNGDEFLRRACAGTPSSAAAAVVFCTASPREDE